MLNTWEVWYIDDGTVYAENRLKPGTIIRTDKHGIPLTSEDRVRLQGHRQAQETSRRLTWRLT